jgi:hypothetical protein
MAARLAGEAISQNMAMPETMVLEWAVMVVFASYGLETPAPSHPLMSAHRKEK